jgi:hypothetical protein
MEDYDALPEAFKKINRSLLPFIKQRQEAAQIRRILSSHLRGHLNVDGGLPVSRPLSLVDQTSSIDATPHGVRGVQKEYLRCVRANIKARKEYSKASKDHHVGQEGQGSGVGVRERSTSQDGTENSMESFLDLVRQRQNHERLWITQDYIDMLSRKPAASVDHLDLQEVLKDVETLPKVPPEVVNASSSSHMPDGRDLEELVDRLGKSVLRAKMLLKKEQKLLAKVQAENPDSSVQHGSRLQAVDATRHELINWIEGELGRAGDSPPEAEEDHGPTTSMKHGREYIDAELTATQRQYARYTKAREAIVVASSGRLGPQPSPEFGQDNSLQPAREELHSVNGMNQATYPYLEAMILVSNEQKAMIQQKSHLTITLSKQLKEGSQGLDRLADESHLLPAHPIPTASLQRTTLEGAVSFGDQMSNQEKPDASRRARAWVFASESATNATKEAISEKLEEGEKSVIETQKTLLELDNLLGRDGKGDIWGTVDGNLGVIEGEAAGQS